MYQIEPLTNRQNQLVKLISLGFTNREIAEELFLSEKTVKWHLYQLYQKLGVRNRTSALAKIQCKIK